MLVGVWLMEFYEWVVLYFGVVYGLLVLFDYVLIGFDGCSVVQVIEDGVEFCDVWWVLCVDFDVFYDWW